MAFHGFLQSVTPSVSGRGVDVVFAFTDDADPAFTQTMQCGGSQGGIVTPTPEWQMAVVTQRLAELQAIKDGFATLSALVGQEIVPPTDVALTPAQVFGRAARALLAYKEAATVTAVDPADVASVQAAVDKAYPAYNEAVLRPQAALAATPVDVGAPAVKRLP